MSKDADFLRFHLAKHQEDREASAQRQLARSPNLRPVIVTVNSGAFNLRVHKYAFPFDTPVYSMISVLRRYLVPAMNESESLTAIAQLSPMKRNPEGAALPSSYTVGEAYDKYVYADGFLYIRLYLMETFGGSE